MAVFCPKCGKRTFNEYKCDSCQNEIKKMDYKELDNFTNNTLNTNKIITMAIVIIAIAVSYLAINKLTEDTPQEKALKALYGTSNPKEIKNINNEIIKESEKTIEEAGKKQIELFKNILGNK